MGASWTATNSALYGALAVSGLRAKFILQCDAPLLLELQCFDAVASSFNHLLACKALAALPTVGLLAARCACVLL